VKIVLWPWNAVVLPEIMAGALQEGKRGMQGGVQTVGQQALCLAAKVKRESVKHRKVIRSSGMRHQWGTQLACESQLGKISDKVVGEPAIARYESLWFCCRSITYNANSIAIWLE